MRRHHLTRGQSLLEYAISVALVALIAVLASMTLSAIFGAGGPISLPFNGTMLVGLGLIALALAPTMARRLRTLLWAEDPGQNKEA